MRSYLVVGNQTLGSATLAAAIAERVNQGPSSFHVVVPAAPVQRGLTWNEEEARQVASERLEAMLTRLRALGVEVSGEIGARDPIEAVEDAIRGRSVDEILLSTLPAGISRWLGQDVPTRLKGSVAVPVVTLTAERESVSTSGG